MSGKARRAPPSITRLGENRAPSQFSRRRESSARRSAIPPAASAAGYRRARRAGKTGVRRVPERAASGCRRHLGRGAVHASMPRRRANVAARLNRSGNARYTGDARSARSREAPRPASVPWRRGDLAQGWMRKTRRRREQRGGSRARHCREFSAGGRVAFGVLRCIFPCNRIVWAGLNSVNLRRRENSSPLSSSDPAGCGRQRLCRH